MGTPEKLGNFTPNDAPKYEDILQCMRCGFCLPTCPTFSLTSRERSSPRGRVALARAVAEGKLEFNQAMKEEAFFCLDCRACTTACPSGVQAGSLMEICRAQASQQQPLPKWQAGFRKFILQKMLPNPDLLETSMLPACLYQKLGIQWLVRHSKLLKLGPKWIDKAEGMMPELHQPLRQSIPQLSPATGEKRGTVAFFLGCVMTLMYAEVSKQTVRILNHQGFDVITPKTQKCCGAPHMTEGDPETARQLARHNLDVFLNLNVDAIVTDCAGCGSALKEYQEMLAEREDHQRLQKFHSKVKDISEFLVEVGIRTDELKPVNKVVTYHEPCHLCHAQGISTQPREVIKSIPGIELREMKESNWCCGSAATFSLKFTEASQKILDRKLDNVRESKAEVLVTSNPGCHLQLDWGLREAEMPQPVLHLSELLGEATPDR